MRVGALVLGVVGGIFGLIAALLALGIGGAGSAFGTQGSGTVVGLGFSAIAFSLLGLLGAGLAMAKPRFAATLLLVSAIGFLISVSWFALITTPLFLLAGLLAFLGRGRTAVRA